MYKLTVKGVESIVSGNKVGRYGFGRGVYLMIPKSGEPYWMLRYTTNKKRRSMTVCKVSEITIKDLPLKIEQIKKQINEGVDPLTERQFVVGGLKTVDDLFEDWYLEIEKRLKHPRIPKRIYKKEVSPSIGNLSIDKVRPLHIRSIIQAITESGRKSISNDSLMYCKQLFRHAIKLDLIQNNPAGNFTVTDAGGVEASRDRVLSLKEVREFFKVCKISGFARENYLACALLLSLGVRKSELLESSWSEFDMNKKIWSLPSSRSKTGVGIKIPLPGSVISWLDELKVRSFNSKFVFPNRRPSKNPYMGSDTLNRAISKLFGRESGRKVSPPNLMGDIKHFTVHDLRRTFRSILSSEGVSGFIAERCVNHKLKGSEGIYDRYDYFEERKEALNKLSEIITPIVDGADVMVIKHNHT